MASDDGGAAATTTSATATRKRRRSPMGCMNAENDGIVEELRRIRGKVREASHLAASYGRAILSVQGHQEQITSAAEAKQLRGIGNYIANQIQAFLHRQRLGEGPGPRGGATSQPNVSGVATPTTATVASNGTSKRQRVREGDDQPRSAPTQEATAATEPLGRSEMASEALRDYAPAHRKQPWYVILVLHDLQAFCIASAITTPLLLGKMQDAGYDGTMVKLRSCLSVLVGTHKVIQRTSCGRVYLSDRGKRSAALCPGKLFTAPSLQSGTQCSRGGATNCFDRADSGNLLGVDTDDLEPASPIEDEQPPTNDGEPESEPLDGPASCDLVRPGDVWEVVLVLDHREILSRRNRDILERKLLESNVTCEVRSLNVGDVQWVARRYRNGLADEFMLNVIVERKEVKDLSGSIVDRRYSEQKARLRDSGMTHVIYLVEGSMTQQTTVRSSGIQTALCRTQVQNQFFVQVCQNADESVAFLRGVHRRLLAALPSTWHCRNHERTEIMASSLFPRMHNEKQPSAGLWVAQFCDPVRTFAEFNSQFRKKSDFIAGEVYQMMLMQVPNLSSSRTVAVSSTYPTFQHLLAAFHSGKRIQDLRYGESQRRMGPKVDELLRYLLLSTDYEVDCPVSTATTEQ